MTFCVHAMDKRYLTQCTELFMPILFHLEVDTVVPGKAGSLGMVDRTLPASGDGLNLTACLCTGTRLVEVQSLCCPSYLCSLPRQSHEVINAPTEGEAAVWSCTMLFYRITERDYGGESLNAEIVGALQSSSALPDLAAAK